jgi:hypothetical protein
MNSPATETGREGAHFTKVGCKYNQKPANSQIFLSNSKKITWYNMPQYATFKA